jgi:hypothetical protein
MQASGRRFGAADHQESTRSTPAAWYTVSSSIDPNDCRKSNSWGYIESTEWQVLGSPSLRWLDDVCERHFIRSDEGSIRWVETGCEGLRVFGISLCEAVILLD